MANHMSDVGFPTDTPEDFDAWAKRAVEAGQRVECPDRTSYVRWEAGAGAELWAQLDEEGFAVGLNPHYAGATRMRVGIVDRVEREGIELDGAFHVWASPPDGEPGMGAYPFVFDVPDYRRHGAIAVPSIAEAQIVAFGHHVEAYPTDAAYSTSQDEWGLASEAFIPSGIFTPDFGTIDPPEARAILSGHVLDTSLLVNPATKVPFR